MFWPVDAALQAEHVMSDDGFCWCQPSFEEVLPFGGIVVHRHFMDRPEYTGNEVPAGGADGDNWVIGDDYLGANEEMN